MPASGAGGLALGAWVLNQGGMPGDQIARRSVAFFLIKSSVNFVAVAVLGFLFAVGLIGPHQPLWRTLVPAADGHARDRRRPGDPAPAGPPATAARAQAAPLDRRRQAGAGGGDRRGAAHPAAQRADGDRRRDRLLAVGQPGPVGDVQGHGASVPLSIILMGYLIGQLGGLLPIPGGLGGIDGGLLGTLIVFGAPAAATAAAVLAYRVILFWLPLIAGAIAFYSLQKGLNDPSRPDLCVVPAGA